MTFHVRGVQRDKLPDMEQTCFQTSILTWSAYRPEYLHRNNKGIISERAEHTMFPLKIRRDDTFIVKMKDNETSMHFCAVI